MPFSEKTLDFLFENRLQDSKDWFDAHKKDYLEYVLHPLEELTVVLADTAIQLDPLVTTDAKVGKTISRIRRDTRFTNDKRIYREHMWIIFKRGPRMYGEDAPGIYFDISPDSFSYGCGYYSASPAYMEAMRAAILAGSPEAIAAIDAYEAQSVFVLEGDRYKRPHYPDQPEKLRKWLELRNIALSADSTDAALLFSGDLAEKVAKDLLLLKPMYRFMLKIAIQVYGGVEIDDKE